VRRERARRRGLAAGIVGGAALAVLAGVVLLALSAGGSNGTYRVRAIFDDAGNIIPGEDVKIAGVKVGAVGSVTPTITQKAAVVLEITNPGFQDFRADASCGIRPQALIGEKYVDCLPTQPRVEGTPLPPPLRKIRHGEGTGQYLLPVTNTSSPVDVDLLGDINRLPERQRLTIILNELGAGLAGRGSDLNVVIRRADPALQELDKVLGILAGENKVIAELAVTSDKALAPFARVRERVANFIVQSNKVAQASAATRGALKRNLELFPPFLEQLSPAMDRLARFADETTGVFQNLKVAAPGLNQTFTSLPAFSKSSELFFANLGKTAKVSGPALVGTEPLLKQLKAFGTAAKPFSTNFAALLTSFRETGGLERLLDFMFMGTNAANGYDALGHFLRAEGVGTACLKYQIKPTSLCARHLGNTGEPPTTTAAARTADVTAPGEVNGLVMARTLAVIKGATPAQALAEYPGPNATASELVGGVPSVAPTGAGSQPVGGSTAGTTYYSPSSEGSEAGGMLLNYLLGN
jgi:ABC-type transporter Mla subunit MlaD